MTSDPDDLDERLGQLIMPHPRDTDTDFGNSTKYMKLMKGPHSEHPIWEFAEEALGVKVKFSNSNVKIVNGARAYGFQADSTLHILHVDKGSVLDKLGVKAGWKITSINDRPIVKRDDTEAEFEILNKSPFPISIRFNLEKLAFEDPDPRACMPGDQTNEEKIKEISGDLEPLVKAWAERMMTEKEKGDNEDDEKEGDDKTVKQSISALRDDLQALTALLTKVAKAIKD